MSDFAEIRAALMAVVDQLEALPMPHVTNTWHQATASVASLTTGSTNPLAEQAADLLRRTTDDLMTAEGAKEEVRSLIEELIATW